MGDDMKVILVEAAKKFAEVVATMSVNMVSCTISESIKPRVIDAIKDELEDAQAAMGKIERAKDRLAQSDLEAKGEEDLYILDVEGWYSVWTRYYSGYSTFVVWGMRIGKEKDGDFYATGRRHQVRWGQFDKMLQKAKKEFPEAKDLPVLPPDWPIGTYCLCLNRNTDATASSYNLRKWCQAMVKLFPNSKSIPSHWYMGDDHERQLHDKAVFDLAYELTRDKHLWGYAWHWELPPFDEGEAMTQLLQNVADRDIIPRVHALTPAWLPYCIRRSIYYTADAAVIGAVGKAMDAGWPPVQGAIDTAKKKVNEVVEKGIDAIIDKLKPVLEKVVNIVKEKMKKKEEEKEEKEEKKKPEIGDVVKTWKFEGTAIGKKFFDGLAGKDARGALDDMRRHQRQALENHLEEQLKKAAGGGKGGNEFVMAVMEKVADYIARVIQKYTTIDPLMKAARKMFDIRWDLEDKLVAKAGNKADIEQLIRAAASEMWATYPEAGIIMFKDLWHLKKDISHSMRGEVDEAIEVLTDVADYMFEVQMRCLNALRVEFVQALLAKAGTLNDEAAVRSAVRVAFRDATFKVLQVLMEDAWIHLGKAFIKSVQIMCKAKFKSTVWPTIEEGLNALQAMIPDPLGDMGLKIPSIAMIIINVMIDGAVNKIMGKLIRKCEAAIFEQEAAAGDAVDM